MARQDFRCDTCKSNSENPCNLVVFIDGTSNKFGPTNTNVVKLFRQVKTDIDGPLLKQSKNYWSGIGTQSDGTLKHVGKKINRLIEMAFAWNVENNVKEAYSWLVDKYEKDAQLYLFGFSRGAYQVRVLATLIHEVGLTRNKEHIEAACDHYRCIRTREPKAREMAMDFKKTFCWPGVRIHFVGVWDTVSSIGLFKRDAFVSASTSMTSACYFRHALALDEYRVKFMPEYFAEVNAYRKEVQDNATSDRTKEVWFAGSHGDVGGLTRPNRMLLSRHDNDHLYHAGYIPLLWMRREASAKGLILEPEDVIWVPDDVSHGRMDSMTVAWWFFEVFPVRYQVSFCGTGTHKRRWHWFQPRRIIPNQKIHDSILSVDGYTPRATHGNGIDIPIALRRTIQTSKDGLWTTEVPDEEATTRLLISLLGDPHKMLDSLERVLSLLDSKRGDNTWVQRMLDWPQSFESFIRGRSDFPKFASTIVYFIVSAFSIPEDIAQDAGQYLIATLSQPEHPDCPRALSVLRFLTRYQTPPLDDLLMSSVIQALMYALQWTVNNRNTGFFPLLLDSLCNLIGNDNLRAELIHQLCDKPHENRTAEPSYGSNLSSSRNKLSSMLEVKAPSQLVASLRMIITLALYRPDACGHLKARILELARKGTGRVGSTAVEALVALNPNEPLTLNIRLSNVLRYLGNTLPQLDMEDNSFPSPYSSVEMSSATSPDDENDLSSLRGKPKLGNEIMCSLVSIAGSWNMHERTAAILILLKLCEDWKSQEHIRSKALDIFIRQLRGRKTSLLASYALKTCLEHGMKEYINIVQIAPPIVTMLNKGWFDDAVGQIEGYDVFRGLMKDADLKREVMRLDTLEYLVKELEVVRHDEARKALIGLDTLVGNEREKLEGFVNRGLNNLRSPRRKIQSKGVKILSALAQMSTGEEVIRPHVADIVEMLLPPGYSQAVTLQVSNSPSGRPTQSIRSVLNSEAFGPIAALYAISRNDELRREIKCSAPYASLRHLYQTNMIYKKRSH